MTRNSDLVLVLTVAEVVKHGRASDLGVRPPEGKSTGREPLGPRRGRDPIRPGGLGDIRRLGSTSNEIKLPAHRRHAPFA